MSLDNLFSKLKAQGFYGHAGRPGKRGGSLPKGGSSGMDKFGIESKRATLSTGQEVRVTQGKTSAQLKKMSRSEFIQSFPNDLSKKSVKRNYNRIERELGQKMSPDQERAFREYFLGLTTHDEATRKIGVSPTED